MLELPQHFIPVFRPGVLRFLRQLGPFRARRFQGGGLPPRKGGQRSRARRKRGGLGEGLPPLRGSGLPNGEPRIPGLRIPTAGLRKSSGTAPEPGHSCPRLVFALSSRREGLRRTGRPGRETPPGCRLGGLPRRRRPEEGLGPGHRRTRTLVFGPRAQGSGHRKWLSQPSDRSPPPGRREGTRKRFGRRIRAGAARALRIREAEDPGRTRGRRGVFIRRGKRPRGRLPEDDPACLGAREIPDGDWDTLIGAALGGCRRAFGPLPRSLPLRGR